MLKQESGNIKNIFENYRTNENQTEEKAREVYKETGRMFLLPSADRWTQRELFEIDYNE